MQSSRFVSSRLWRYCYAVMGYSYNMQKKLSPPRPLIGKDKPVDWLLVYKFNAANFPGCTDDGTTPKVGSTGIFGGTVEAYKSGHSQQYVYASSVNPELVKGEGCVGATYTDPLGATFAQVYDTPGYYYVLWNDQFYNNPIKTGKEHTGHSKGMLAWNEDGEGMVMQVSTPSWPASGSKAHPRQNDGNTLGCINDDDVEVAQHFFAFSINKDDLVAILTGINNASVVTSTAHPEIVQNGGPAEVQTLVNELGKESKGTTVIKSRLSNGIQLISKPSRLAVPPWQMVSAELGGIPLRVASWWAEPFIYSTSADTPIACWPESLAKPGPVAIATTGNLQEEKEPITIMLKLAFPWIASIHFVSLVI
jgi:Deoxyribonuclease II